VKHRIRFHTLPPYMLEVNMAGTSSSERPQEVIGAWWRGEGSLEDLERALRDLAPSSGVDVEEVVREALFQQPETPPDGGGQRRFGFLEALTLALVSVAVVVATVGTLLVGLNLPRSTESPVTPIARLENRVSNLERRLQAIRQAPEGIEALPTQVAQMQRYLGQIQGAVDNLNNRLANVEDRIAMLQTRMATPSPTPTPPPLLPHHLPSE